MALYLVNGDIFRFLGMWIDVDDQSIIVDDFFWHQKTVNSNGKFIWLLYAYYMVHDHLVGG